MSLLALLNIGLGLILIYLVTAISCTAATESVCSLLGLRWKTLSSILLSFFNNKEALENFYKSPIIKPLFRGKQKPAFISATHFSAYVFEQIFSTTKSDDIMAARDIIAKMQLGDEVKNGLITILGNAEGSLDLFRAKVEKWFDSAMENASSWYKNRTRIISLIIALGIAGIGNIDTIAIAKHLSSDSAARAAYSTAALTFVESKNWDLNNLTDDQQKILQLLERDYRLPIGWTGMPAVDFYGWVLRILGILMTGFAVSLGAPFWFDILTRIAEIRKQANAAMAFKDAEPTGKSA